MHHLQQQIINGTSDAGRQQRSSGKQGRSIVSEKIFSPLKSDLKNVLFHLTAHKYQQYVKPESLHLFQVTNFFISYNYWGLLLLVVGTEDIFSCRLILHGQLTAGAGVVA